MARGTGKIKHAFLLLGPTLLPDSKEPTKRDGKRWKKTENDSQTNTQTDSQKEKKKGAWVEIYF